MIVSYTHAHAHITKSRMRSIGEAVDDYYTFSSWLGIVVMPNIEYPDIYTPSPGMFSALPGHTIKGCTFYSPIF
jgi:hypothetical protein